MLDDTDPGRKFSPGLARTQSPEQTLRSISARMARFGITRLADVTGLDSIGIPVALAIRPAARSVTVSQGKGVDAASAKVSALMEAIEVWHAENIDAPLRLASIAEVSASGQSVDVARLPVLAGRMRSGASRLLWIAGTDLFSGRSVLVPFEMVHADYALPLKPGHGLFPASTNGLASGNHPLEAICSALCEIVERDAVALWHHTPENRQSATRLTLASIDDSVCRSTCQRIQDASLDVSIWDVTSDLGVPCFMCLIHDPGRRDGHIGLGTAANPDKAGALLRALTEAAQTRLTYITGSRDDLDPDEFTPAGLAQKRRFAERLLGAGPPARSFADVPSFRHDTFRAECDWLLQRLRSGGIEQAVAIDLSREDIGIPVVRVIVPGLEAPHDDAGYVPGPRALAAGQGAGA